MPLPNVHYGRASEQETDWRQRDRKFDDLDDDAEMPVTPKSVVAMLGFDPLDLEGGDEVPAAEDNSRATDADDPGVHTRRMHGLDLVIETPKGHMRSGPGWEVEMAADYGYIEGVKGADGDSLDCYVGDGPGNGWVYVIDQSRVGDRSQYDEAKVMVNFPSMKDAVDCYMNSHHRARDIFLDWTPVPVASFMQTAKSRNPKKPWSK